MTIRIFLEEYTYFRLLWSHVSPFDSQNCKNPPGIYVPRENDVFLGVLFNFNRDFHTFSQHLLTKFFLFSKSPRCPLENLHFSFFISLVLFSQSYFFNFLSLTPLLNKIIARARRPPLTRT